MKKNNLIGLLHSQLQREPRRLHPVVQQAFLRAPHGPVQLARIAQAGEHLRLRPRPRSTIFRAAADSSAAPAYLREGAADGQPEQQLHGLELYQVPGHNACFRAGSHGGRIRAEVYDASCCEAVDDPAQATHTHTHTHIHTHTQRVSSSDEKKRRSLTSQPGPADTDPGPPRSPHGRSRTWLDSSAPCSLIQRR